MSISDGKTEYIFVSSFYHYFLGANDAAIFVYIVVPNNSDVTEIVPLYASEVDSQTG